MANPPSTNPVTDKLRQAGADDDATIEQFREVDTTRPLGARNGEHGHIDGPRGRQDFHAHDGGDIDHGHKRGHGLHRTAALSEYVPPLAADPPQSAASADPLERVSKVGPAPASTPGAMGAPETDTPPATVGVGSGAAGPGRPTAGGGERPTSLVVADAAALQDLGSRMEATERKIRRRLAEFKTVAAMALLVDAALKQLDYDDVVAPSVVAQLRDMAAEWAADRGVSRS